MKRKYFVEVLKHNPEIGVGTQWKEHFDTKRDALKFVHVLNEETKGMFEAKLLSNKEAGFANSLHRLFGSIRSKARKRARLAHG